MMALTDLVSKRVVLDTLEELFRKYKINFKPEGDVDRDGFCAAVPKTIQALPAEYDVSSVITAIEDGQSLNIPHQGYCMNKDIAMEIIRSGWNNVTDSKDIVAASDDVDKAISFFALHTICDDDCTGRNCMACNRYIAKKQAMIGLNFYRKVQDMLTRLQYLAENAESDDEKKYYNQVLSMFQESYDYANDRTNLC